MSSPALSLESILAAMTCLCSSSNNGAHNFYSSLANQVNMQYPNESIAMVKPNEITEIKERLDDLETTLAELKELQYNVLDAVSSRSDTYSISDQCPNNVKKGEIQLRVFSFIKVLCEEYDGSGWMVVLYRFNGEEIFEKSWHLYKEGFGTYDGEFFIGLERLHILTSAKPQELLLEMTNLEGDKLNAHYDRFLVGNSNESYALKAIEGFTGTAYDFFSGQLNTKFSTYDQDNDDSTKVNCAKKYGAWWHSSCAASLNGVYNRGAYWSRGGKGISWRKSSPGPVYGEEEEEEEEEAPPVYGKKPVPRKGRKNVETVPGPEYAVKAVKLMIRAKPD